MPLKELIFIKISWTQQKQVIAIEDGMSKSVQRFTRYHVTLIIAGQMSTTTLKIKSWSSKLSGASFFVLFIAYSRTTRLVLSVTLLVSGRGKHATPVVLSVAVKL